MEKIFKTLDEQIKILKDKGLTIPDEEYAKEILLRENYFFLSGYRHLFMESNTNRVFIKGTTFNELYSVFYFDRHVRNIIFKNLLIIENNIKSIMAYELSMKYGIREEQYLNPRNFIRDADKKRQVNDLLKKLKRQIRMNGGQHQATQHYLEHYGYIPLWIVVKILSFGIVGEFYSILKPEDQKEIAAFFHVKSEDLLIWLPILANYRNLCAHEDLLYNHKAQRPIPDTRFHKALEIAKEDGEYIYGKDDLYALVIILKNMLRADDFYLMMENIDYEINLLGNKLKTISIQKVLNSMGFPMNYKEIVRL